MDSKNSLQIAKMKNSSQETRDYAFQMEAVKKNLLPPVDKEKKLRESCEGFESIFIQKMWEQMRATIPESNLLKGREEKFWQGMYDQELSKTIAGAGGIGLADMMYEQLSRNLRSASKDAADARGGRGMGFAEDILPAPMLPPSGPPRSQAKTEAAVSEAPAGRPKPSTLAGLYAEAMQPEARPADAPQAATPASPGAMAARARTENESNPAIMAVLNELRSRQTGVPAGGAQPRPGAALGAQPPLPPMRDGQVPPAEQQEKPPLSTLAKPVHKPVSGKRSVLPRAAGPRVPAGQPVNRNLPFMQQAAQQVQAQNPLQSSSASLPGPSLPGPASSGQNSPGVDALNAFAAQQRAAAIPPAPGASAPGGAAPGRPN